MKTKILAGLLVAAFAGVVHGTIIVNSDWAVGAAIEDGNPAGSTFSQTFSGLDPSGINGVDVRLHISGGYNGDLYGYLVLRDANAGTSTAILLNRVGTTPTDPFGSAGSGFDVTLSDTGTGSIHDATGNPSGTFLADQAAGLTSTFAGMTANGTWTLFLADMSGGGGQSTLDSWGLDITVVPEPTASALLVFCAILSISLMVRRRNQAMRVAGRLAGRLRG